MKKIIIPLISAIICIYIVIGFLLYFIFYTLWNFELPKWKDYKEFDESVIAAVVISLIIATVAVMAIYISSHKYISK